MNDDDIDELLAPDRLSGAERDRILQHTLRQAKPPAKGFAWAYAFAAAAAVAVVFITQYDDGLRSKGDGTPLAIEARCAGACAAGSTLTFTVHGAHPGGFFYAYAVASNGDRVWYFPSATDEAPQLEASQSTAVVPVGVRLGPEHAPGTWRLVMGMSTHRLSRTELDTLTLRTEQALEITP